MSADGWERVDARDFFRDVDKAKAEPYKLEPHSFVKPKRMPWIICQGCGLVSLRNPLTAWCEKHGCRYRKHPEYERKVKAHRNTVDNPFA